VNGARSRHGKRTSLSGREAWRFLVLRSKGSAKQGNQERHNSISAISFVIFKRRAHARQRSWYIVRQPEKKPRSFCDRQKNPGVGACAAAERRGGGAACRRSGAAAERRGGGVARRRNGIVTSKTIPRQALARRTDQNGDALLPNWVCFHWRASGPPGGDGRAYASTSCSDCCPLRQPVERLLRFARQPCSRRALAQCLQHRDCFERADQLQRLDGPKHAQLL
jgi:hypothetical protein